MTGKRHSSPAGKPPAVKTLWAYGYEVVTPGSGGGLEGIRGILARQNADAALHGRTWNARLVTTRLTHLLVVSESPELDCDINHALEAELTQLGVQYLQTAPMRVDGAADPVG
jgi:hypothetical protein